jgi:hypothetical protein
MTRRQGATSEVVIGACNQSNRRCQAITNRLGPLIVGSGRLTVCVSEGVSQYGLASARQSLAVVLAGGRSGGADMIDSFSSAPTCSWNALIVLRILRANQTPATKKAS